jgi:hypothetical protein
MNIPNFLNKSIIAEIPVKNTTPLSPISQRISPDLYSQFSNLNFAGVYRLGSEIDKRLCYIGASYNLTDKITHHVNLLYRKEHHSKELQDWVNVNGIESLDISVLKQCKSIPTEISNWEQYFLTLIKPKFNTVLNKKDIKIEIRKYKPIRYAAVKTLNEFNNPIVIPRKKDTEYEEVVFTNSEVTDERHKGWKPTIVICLDDDIIRIKGDVTNFSKVKKLHLEMNTDEVPITRRNIGFNAR